eukprot:5219829-Amphidinium_carterae.3
MLKAADVLSSQKGSSAMNTTSASASLCTPPDVAACVRQSSVYHSPLALPTSSSMRSRILCSSSSTTDRTCTAGHGRCSPSSVIMVSPHDPPSTSVGESLAIVVPNDYIQLSASADDGPAPLSEQPGPLGFVDCLQVRYGRSIRCGVCPTSSASQPSGEIEGTSDLCAHQDSKIWQCNWELSPLQLCKRCLKRWKWSDNTRSWEIHIPKSTTQASSSSTNTPLALYDAAEWTAVEGTAPGPGVQGACWTSASASPTAQ